MKGSGYEFEPLVYDWNEPRSPISNHVGRRLFNEQIASQYGYHTGPASPYKLKMRAQLDSFAAQSQRWVEQWDSCSAQVFAEEPFSSMYSSSGVYFTSNVTNDEVEQAVGKWRECMAPLGVSDLPDSPEDMPSDSLAQKFGLDAADPVNGIESTSVSGEEIKTAIHDARCQQSSGYRQAYYQAEWDSDQAIVSGNKDALEARRQQVQTNTEELKKIITDYIKGNS
ncbi:hypothetical protein [Actinomyces trachealis]|uniref:hypothetical protein n=1 Tax=Actinomyces trachealis TaxID=2763540 RepID=UPI001892B289|nr:hypothetical protein [Actinomyces trachealis]